MSTSHCKGDAEIFLQHGNILDALGAFARSHTDEDVGTLSRVPSMGTVERVSEGTHHARRGTQTRKLSELTGCVLVGYNRVMDEARQRSEALLEFTDKDGATFRLSPKALHHIKHDNLVNDPASFIQEAFRNTIAVVKSRWHPTRELYYAPFGTLYRTVVVDNEDGRIKTAYISDSIKGGGVRWVNPRLMN